MKDISYAEYKALAKPFSGTIESVATGPYGLYFFREKIIALGAVEVFKTVDALGEINMVVISVYRDEDGKPQRILWCGDQLLEGKASADRRTAYEGLRDAKPKKLAKKMDELITSCKGLEPVACSFWRLRTKKQLCVHSAGVMALPDIDSRFEALETALGDYEKMDAAAAGAASGPVAEALELAFRVPVLLEGDRGSGKTTFVRQLAYDNKFHFIEVGGNESMEAIDLLGMDKRYNGETVWYDGGLTRAFRLAASGKKVVLLIDEMLRIRQRELSILLSALSPFRGHYRLNTGRILSAENGLAAETEEILAPVANIAIYATTNVGLEYAVDEMDPAVEERFEVVFMDTTKDTLKSALKSVLDGRGFSLKIADKMVALFDALNLMVENGSLNRGPTIRTLTRAVELASDEDDIQRHLFRAARHWVDRTAKGKPVPEQVALAEKTIRTVL